MCWHKEPPRLGRSEEPVVSRDLLRSVCEPFFEQMLTALQEALEEQGKRQREEQVRNVQNVAQCQNFLPLQRLDPTPDEESTDVEGFGAFASLLSGPCSSPSTSDRSDIPTTRPSDLASGTFCQPLTQTHSLKEEPDQISDQEKSTMVCRHWKSKGWCRLESNCKFLHPEHKRGVAGTKASSTSSTNRGDISGSDCHGIRTTLKLSEALSNDGQVPVAAASGQKKKKSKVKSAKGHKEETLGASEKVATSFFNEQGISCAPCIPTVQFFVPPGELLE